MCKVMHPLKSQGDTGWAVTCGGSEIGRVHGWWIIAVQTTQKEKGTTPMNKLRVWVSECSWTPETPLLSHYPFWTQFYCSFNSFGILCRKCVSVYGSSRSTVLFPEYFYSIHLCCVSSGSVPDLLYWTGVGHGHWLYRFYIKNMIFTVWTLIWLETELNGYVSSKHIPSNMCLQEWIPDFWLVLVQIMLLSRGGVWYSMDIAVNEKREAVFTGNQL